MTDIALLGRAGVAAPINGRADVVAALDGRFQQAAGVTDSFTDTDGVALEDHAPDSGGGAWAKVVFPVSATIEGNQIEELVGSATPATYALRVLPSGGHVMTMQVVQSGGAGGIGFIAHRVGNTLYWAVHTGTTYSIVIVNPGLVTLESLVEAAPAEPWTIELRVRYGDDDLVLLADGVEKLRSSNADLLGGQSGIYIHGFGATAQADDFRLVERHGRQFAVDGRQDTARALDGRADVVAVLDGGE